MKHAPRSVAAWLRSLLARIRDWLYAGATGLLVLSGLVGLFAGLGAVGFRYLIFAFTRVFSGHQDYSAAGHAINPLVPGLGMWFVVLAPVVGGLIYGPLIAIFAREARGHGVPEVMLAVQQKGGRIRPQVAIVKSLASALCIGAGGSVGREGPIVQIGSAVGSALGQAVRLPESRMRLLVACGAAGGISATFNTPIAGVFFAMELILRDFDTRSLGNVVVASVGANVVSRAFFGDASFLKLPVFHLVSPWEFVLYAVLGAVAALAGLAFIRILYGTEDLMDQLWRGHPEWARPAVGGVALGLLLLALPQMYGVGYPVLQGAINGRYVAWFMVVLLVGKMAATSLTIGIGGSGGVFAPSLFMGAMLGTAFGQLVHAALPGITASPGAYGLVGMGAVFAAASRAPMTAILMIFELTGEYRIILPLMLAVALATGLSHLLSRDTIYTLKLRRRGIEIGQERRPGIVDLLTVSDAMRGVPRPLEADDDVHEVIARLTKERREALPVVDAQGQFLGTVSHTEVERAIRGDDVGLTAGALADDRVTLRAGQRLEQAIVALTQHEAPGLAVLADTDRKLIGWITHRDVLQAYARRLRGGGAVPAAPATERPTAAPAGQRRQPTPSEEPTPADTVDTADTGPPAAPARGAHQDVVVVSITSDSAPAGVTVAEAGWPPSARIILIHRGNQALKPSGQTVLKRGDRVVVSVAREEFEQLGRLVEGHDLRKE